MREFAHNLSTTIIQRFSRNYKASMMRETFPVMNTLSDN